MVRSQIKRKEREGRKEGRKENKVPNARGIRIMQEKIILICSLTLDGQN
jgi:hypothetical protein